MEIINHSILIIQTPSVSYTKEPIAKNVIGKGNRVNDDRYLTKERAREESPRNVAQNKGRNLLDRPEGSCRFQVYSYASRFHFVPPVMIKLFLTSRLFLTLRVTSLYHFHEIF